jgi:hypothetical protein
MKEYWEVLVTFKYSFTLYEFTSTLEDTVAMEVKSLLDIPSEVREYVKNIFKIEPTNIIVTHVWGEKIDYEVENE